MKLSEVHTAKNLKFKLIYKTDKPDYFKEEQVINIENGSRDGAFIVNIPGEEGIIVYANGASADSLSSLLDEDNYFKYIFEIDSVTDKFIEVQSYVFRKPRDFSSSITIGVPKSILEQYDSKKLKEMFVWNGLGKPAIFSLSYKENAKKKADIRLISDKKWMFVQNTLQGLKCVQLINIKNSDRPVDIFFASDISFVLDESSNIAINDEFSNAIEQVNEQSKYFTRWDAYNKLVEEILNKKAEELGEVKYSNYDVSYKDGKIFYRFYIQGNQNELSIDDNDVKYSLKVVNGVNVGDVIKMTNEYIETSIEERDNLSIVPKEGSLCFDSVGDKAIIKRRNIAKERMIKGQCPIKLIVPLIENGLSENMNYKDTKIPDSVTEYVGHIKGIKNFKFNQQQEYAIKLAMFTPDIAIIQGPPGTGKTTVIQGICQWFKENYKKEEKAKKKDDENYVIKTPHILISSFQNVAVDKAISNSSAYGMPAKRIAKRDLLLDKYREDLTKWKKNCNDEIEKIIDEKSTIGFVEEKRNLADKYFVFKQSGEKIEDAIKLIKYYKSFIGIDYTEQTKKLVNLVLGEYEKSQNMQEDEDNLLLVNRINSLRLDRNSFLDDGKRNAKKFLTYISMIEHNDIDERILSKINRVVEDAFSENDFNDYVNSVNELKDRFCKDNTKELVAQELIDKCIMSLYEDYTNSFVDSLDDINDKKSLIISEFLDDFNVEYETLVDRYSPLVGATCQTSLKLQDDVYEYDLVIVDEAARANPLDLFIPMSLGKKIILVGDQKQLPHMLEPDVLAVLKNDERFKDMTYFEISLFEKLFDMFKRDNIYDSKSIQLKYQRRMNPQICEFVSQQFYDGELKSDPSAIESLSANIPSKLCNGKPLAYIDINPSDNRFEIGGQSKKREVEAVKIDEYIAKIKENDPEAEIDVITFYSEQKTLITEKVFNNKDETYKKNIKIGTVDAFQGEEADYVLLSCVRSNNISKEEIERKIEKKITYLSSIKELTQSEIDNMCSSENIDEEYVKARVGFLIKPNRLCVAFSRAKKQLVVFGDSKTLDIIPSFNMLHKICKEGDGYYSYE